MSKKNFPHNRKIQIANQIQRELSKIIIYYIKDPRIILVTIQNVKITSDYTHAKIYFTTLSQDPGKIEKVLSNAAKYLQNLLFKRLRIHTIPSLHFFYDNTIEKLSKISNLINKENQKYNN